MNKHTPGPWGTYLNAKDDMLIRKMSKDGYEECVIASGVRYEDARLIAAAPELLAALRNLSDLYDTDEGCRSLPEYIAARAAIAKAEGTAND